MSLDRLPALHLKALLDGLPVFERYGLLLAGGYAFRAHEILRLTAKLTARPGSQVVSTDRGASGLTASIPRARDFGPAVVPWPR